MASIAYVDHSYHRLTRSTMFLPEVLRAHGHSVEVFWDEAWTGGEPVQWRTVESFDVVMMFQSQCPLEGLSFRSLHPNVVYVPMYDQFDLSLGAAARLAAFWKPFLGSKVLAFSSAVHLLATVYGVRSHAVRYFPDVPGDDALRQEGLHGFFWLRRQMEVDWDVIRTLIGATPFDSFHLHVAGDPGFPPVKLPHPMDRKAQNVRISTWFEDRADFDAVARHANVYFAPRLAEGIGQAVLEAMARGQCVVAPNRPTMNEYIVHGVNGLLYDPHSLESVDFTDVGRLGLEARRGAVAGRRQWQASASKLVDFVVTPSAALYDERRQRLPDGDERSALSAARRVRGVLGRVRRTVRRHLLE